MKNIILDKNDRIVLMNILDTCIPGCDVYVFGSRITEQVKPFSDLDLLIMSNTPLSSIQRYELAEAFDMSNLAFKVDFIEWTDISDEFKKAIQDDMVLFYKSQSGC